MNNFNNKILIFFISTLLILQNQTLNATNNICAEIEDFDQSSKSKNVIFSQPLQYILQKIKNDEYVSKSALYRIKVTATETLRQLGLQIKPTNDMFDSWITLILMIFPKDTYFDRYLKIAKVKGKSEQTTPAAQSNLAYMYQHGYSINQDLNKAVVFYKKAAERGHITSQNNLGCLYYEGQGIHQDIAQAIKWIQNAANQGHVLAHYNLGYIYYKGHGIEKSYKKAFELVKFAATQGDDTAQYRLGRMYYRGRGVEQDLAHALKWYLESLKNKGTDLNLKSSIKNLLTFIPSNIAANNKINFSISELVKKNTQALSRLYGMKKQANRPDLCFKKSELRIFSYYEKVLLKISDAYQQPGFMITCLRPKKISAFKLSFSPDIEYYEFQGRSYLTFGQNNIKEADRLMNVLSDSNKIHIYYKAISKILDIQINIKESHRIKTLSYLNILNSRSISKDQRVQVKKALADQKKSIETVKKDIEFLYQLQLMPQQLSKSLINDASQRNRLFLQNNNYIKTIFEDR